jgi:hypothetical protein
MGVQVVGLVPGDLQKMLDGKPNTIDSLEPENDTFCSLRSRSETLLWYPTESLADDIGDQEPEHGAEHDSYFQQPA